MSEPAPEEELDKRAAINSSQATPRRALAGASLAHNQVRRLIFLAALLAGLIAFGIGESVYKIIPAEKVLQSVMMTSAKVMAPTPATEDVASARNGALTFGVLGLCLGGALGIAGGLARKSCARPYEGGYPASSWAWPLARACRLVCCRGSSASKTATRMTILLSSSFPWLCTG